MEVQEVRTSTNRDEEVKPEGSIRTEAEPVWMGSPDTPLDTQPLGNLGIQLCRYQHEQFAGECKEW